MRDEYKFEYGKGVRGKYYKRLTDGPYLIVTLDPDVGVAFPNSEAVNAALRSLMKSKRGRRQSSRSG